MADTNGGATIREVQSLLIASEERLGERIDKVSGDLDARLRSVERWAYAIPLGLLLMVASVAGAIIGRGST